MRILALDWGTKRIGAAISDEEGKMAFALDRVIEAAKGIEEITDLVRTKEVGLVLLGLPKTLSGEEVESASKVEKFRQNLVSKCRVEVKMLDERFTSVHAGKLLEMQGVKEKDQREIKDNIAAQIMLQQYLDTARLTS